MASSSGRGAAILALLKKKKEDQAVVGQSSGPEPEEPPKPRGRAALLLKLQEARMKKIGPEGKSSSTPAKVLPAPVPTEEESLQEFITKHAAELQLDDEETVTYRGEVGKPLRVSANYIKLEVEKNRGVFEYEVKFNPELDAKNLRNKLINITMREMGSAHVFDGGTCLYLPEKISDRTVSTTLNGINNDQLIEARIIFKKRKRFGDHECLHLYNVLFKKIMHILLYTQMGRNYFDPNTRYNIPQHKLEVYPGFAVSVDEMEGGLMVCLDTQHRVLRTQNAYELLSEFQTMDPRRFKELAATNIVGMVVLTRYNHKTYTVDDIAWDMCPRDTFPCRDGSWISFVDYYKTNYNISIRDVNQPLLVHHKRLKTPGMPCEKTETMVCLIPELCHLTGLTDAMRNDFRVMKDVAQYTRVTPNQRVAAMKTYLSNINNSEKARAVLKSWGLQIASTNVELPARQMPNEVVIFGDREVQPNNGDWNTAAGQNAITGPVDMHTWIVFHTAKDNKTAQEFASMMTRLGSGMGCTINRPKMVQLPDDRTDTYANFCNNYINQNIQIVVFICPSMRTDRYSVIKKICCTQIPIPSQVINARTLGNPQKFRGIVQKIAMQMTCKLGGTLWTVRFPFKGWMIIGIDVFHGQRGSSDSSVCGFVASLNESISRWYSMATFQNQEVADALKTPFIRALETWRTENGCFPKKIVVIRDGVGDGQLEHCRRYEVEQLESVVRDFNLETKLCFIVVQKRISARLFANTSRGLENPPPGTVVDADITRRKYEDFFLVPQSVRQGTVNPSHYIVLHDSCELKPDHVQRLCYKLCFLYYNYAGTIRVPAPCQYAHRLAALVGQHLKKLPSAVLLDKLFYL